MQQIQRAWVQVAKVSTWTDGILHMYTLCSSGSRFADDISSRIKLNGYLVFVYLGDCSDDHLIYFNLWKIVIMEYCQDKVAYVPSSYSNFMYGNWS